MMQPERVSDARVRAHYGYTVKNTRSVRFSLRGLRGCEMGERSDLDVGSEEVMF